MTYVFTQDVPISAEVYGKIATKVGREPMKGLIVHVASKTTDGKLHYFDVWESKELCDQAFLERISPATRGVLSDSGATPMSEPERQVPVAMALPPSWDEYLSSLPHKDRHELRRKRRRVARERPKWAVRRFTRWIA